MQVGLTERIALLVNSLVIFHGLWKVYEMEVILDICI